MPFGVARMASYTCAGAWRYERSKIGVAPVAALADQVPPLRCIGDHPGVAAANRRGSMSCSWCPARGTGCSAHRRARAGTIFSCTRRPDRRRLSGAATFATAQHAMTGPAGLEISRTAAVPAGDRPCRSCVLVQVGPDLFVEATDVPRGVHPLGHDRHSLQPLIGVGQNSLHHPVRSSGSNSSLPCCSSAFLLTQARANSAACRALACAQSIRSAPGVAEVQLLD